MCKWGNRVPGKSKYKNGCATFKKIVRGRSLAQLQEVFDYDATKMKTNIKLENRNIFFIEITYL